MGKDIINRNVLFHNLFRGEVTGVSDEKITYKPRYSWLSKKLDGLSETKKINYNIYYFNNEDSTLDEEDNMILKFHVDVPLGGSENNPLVKARLLDAKKILYDEKDDCGILKESGYIQNGKWDTFEYVDERVKSATIQLTGKFHY